MKTDIIIWMLVFFVFSAFYIEGEDMIKYRGEAYDLKTGKFIYSENHEELLKNGKPISSNVYYKDKDEKVIAKKTVSFQNSLIAPEYSLDDFRDGYQEGARYSKNGKLILFTRKNSKTPLQEIEVSPKQPVVMDQGFDKFISQNWDTLLKDKVIIFNLPAPFKQDVFEFRVTKISKEKFLEKDAYLFKIEINNSLFRLLLKPIQLYYDAQSKRLLGYIGVSNINDKNGKSYNAKVLFR